MVIRWLIGIVAALIVLLGASQIAFPHWWLAKTGLVMASPLLRFSGLFMIVVAVLLIVAYVKKQVGLRLFVLILGIYLLLAGITILVAPSVLRDLVERLILSHAATVIWTAGLVRVVLGGALLYAVTRLPRNRAVAR